MRKICPLCQTNQSRPLFTNKGCNVVRCGYCGLVYQLNPPSLEEMGKIYNAYYSGADGEAGTSLYVKTERFRLQEARLYLKKIPAVRDLLDVGCGPGFFLKAAKDQGIEATGIDISDIALEYARNNGLDVRVGNFLDIDIPENSKDLVTFWASIEHLHYPKQVLQKTFRILRDQGMVIIETGDVGSFLARAFGKHWRIFERDELTYFSSKTLDYLLDQSGFEVFKTERTGFIEALITQFGLREKTLNKFSKGNYIFGIETGALKERINRFAAKLLLGDIVIKYARKKAQAGLGTLPFISAIVPCRNENKFLRSCLDSIVNNDYPKDMLEVLVVDGMSEDGTRKILRDYSQKYPQIRTLDNFRKITPCALNIGIKEAKGDIIIRMDAHASYAKDYISNCLKYLNVYSADNVGGNMVTLSHGEGVIAKCIARALSSLFGVGTSRFRTGVKEPKIVDTVFGGCYRKEIFQKVGYFNERLPRGQDMEFNLRLKKAGLKTLLVPEIISYYYVDADLRSFIRHNFKNGKWAILPFKYSNIIPVSLRHLVPLGFILALITAFISGLFLPYFFGAFLFISLGYALTNLLFSIIIALKEKDLRYALVMPMMFFLLHIPYAIGSLFGLIGLILPQREKC